MGFLNILNNEFKIVLKRWLSQIDFVQIDQNIPKYFHLDQKYFLLDKKDLGQTQHKSELIHKEETSYLNTSLNSGSSGTGDYASNYKTPNYTQYTQQDFKGNKSKLS